MQTLLGQGLPEINDHAFVYTRIIPQNTYHQFCKNIFSQNGEDGILEQLIQELGITNGTFCEFGAADGVASSNSFNLIKNHKFRGIAIEADRKLYEQCVQNYKQFNNVHVYYGAVLYNHAQYNLDAWLVKAKLPSDFDVLSIDIDGDDYYVWENLTNFKPKIVILETNSYRDPICDELPGYPTGDYKIDLLKLWYPTRVAVGCSFISAIKLGLSKGYTPCAYTGNITFVRTDLVHRLKKFPYIISQNPYDYIALYSHLVLWHDTWMTNLGLILNVAIRDYYTQFKHKNSDLEWLKNRMQQILDGEA